MRTSRYISTISYNSDDYLKFVLDNLKKERKIYFYIFINHKKEDDELKDHKHLLIMPNGLIDTDDLVERFNEHDPLNPDKPKTCIFFKNSTFNDWFLYSSHDKAYLESKGLNRKYMYSINDFVTSDSDFFLDLVHQIDYSKLMRFDYLKISIVKKESFNTILARGLIPVHYVNPYRNAYDELKINFEKYICAYEPDLVDYYSARDYLNDPGKVDPTAWKPYVDKYLKT